MLKLCMSEKDLFIYLFIYCYASVKYFTEFKAEAFRFFHLPKSSTPPFWFYFPLFFFYRTVSEAHRISALWLHVRQRLRGGFAFC